MRKITLKSALVIVTACFIAAAAIPTIKITTQNNQEPQATQGGGYPGGSYKVFTYVGITKFELTDPNNPQNDFTGNSVEDSIRGRGNSTWDQAKKPYRVRFGKKTSLFGKEAAKSWVLLANYYDTTFALNAIAFRLGQKMGLHGTPTSQFADLYLNGSYKGIFQITEQVQTNPGRVDIDKNLGWLVEFDYHSPAPKDIHFTTNQYQLTTFIKSPEDLPDQSGYDFVKREVNELCDSLYSNNFPNNGYRELVDLESFAKYILIQQLMDNFDFNSKIQDGGLPGSNFAYKDFGGKIHAGPLWDFDLAAGVLPPSGMMQNYPTHYATATDSIRPRHPFYQRFFQDEVFLAKFKKAWDNHQNDFNAIPAFIDSIANLLSDRVVDNFSSYSGGGVCFPPFCGGGAGTPMTVDIYKQEIQKLKNWWNLRMQHFTQEINKMNIDTGKDLPSSVAARTKFANGKKVVAVKNYINLRAAANASVKVFGLNGREVRSMKFSKGNHSIRLGDLPAGVYMVKAAVDGERHVLRVSVRR